jgi:hypothetical protein
LLVVIGRLLPSSVVLVGKVTLSSVEGLVDIDEALSGGAGR